jgi:hypothetical protein
MQLFIVPFFKLYGESKSIRSVEVDDAKVGLRTHVPGLEARVLSRKPARDVLSQAGVNFSRTPSGSIVAPPSEAAGALLEFVALP